MTRDINDRELVLTRTLPAEPSRVFEIWTDPASISLWWGPQGFTTTTHAIELRAGGRWRFTMHGPDGRDFGNLVEFIEVDAPHRLKYRHCDEGEAEPVSFHADVTFAPLGEMTLLTMRMVFDSPEALARVEEGYGACKGQYDTLERFAEVLRAYVESPVGPASDREISTSRVLPVPPQRVFEAVSDPVQLATWWGPSGFTNTFETFDFRPGGDWIFTMHGPDGTNHANVARFTTIDAPHRVVVDHRCAPWFTLEILMLPHPEGTKVVFRQVFESARTRDAIAERVGDANEQNLDRLAAALAG